MAIRFIDIIRHFITSKLFSHSLSHYFQLQDQILWRTNLLLIAGSDPDEEDMNQGFRMAPGRGVWATIYRGCNTLGVWLPLIAFHFINMCIIYLIMPLLLKHAYATFSTVCVSYLIVVNSNGVTCECNMNFSYLETWQHGSNMTSIE